jgi:hypothetical protein
MQKERVALEAVRHQYVVSFAGFYGEFRGKPLVGIEENVLKKTDLIPYVHRVTISKLEGSNITPAFLKKHFTVVPLNEGEFDFDESLLQQNLGLCLLPSHITMHRKLEIGDRIVLNAVLSKTFLMREKGGDPDVWAQYLLKNYLERGKPEL